VRLKKENNMKRQEWEVAINLWDFIDVNKLNEFMDEFTGEILENIEYAFDKVDENGNAVMIVNSEK